MMGKGVLKKIGILFVGVSVFLALLITQPWSKYPVLINMFGAFDAETRSQNFRNMETLLPHVLIKPSTNPFQYSVNITPINLTYEFNGEVRSVPDFLERTESSSLLIIKNKEIIFENYLNGADQSSLHTSWSVAKSFISTLIGIALDGGLISSVEDKVSKYLPELENSAYGSASIKDVLQMSSGVDFTESYGATGGNTALAISSVQIMLNKAWILGISLDNQLSGFGKFEDPGERFYYRSSDTHVLSAIIRRVYEEPLEDILFKKIWQPLGMEYEANWSTAARIPIGFCCLNTTSRDFAKLGSLYLNNGFWNGNKIVSETWINQATAPSSQHTEPENIGGHRGYGYQWWVPRNYDGEFFANGIWGQVIWVSKKHNVVIVRTATDPEFRGNIVEMIAVMRALSLATSSTPFVK
ncbi:MAG: serine hydrolase domain-containing protein [Sphingomonadales bacterium]